MRQTEEMNPFRFAVVVCDFHPQATASAGFIRVETGVIGGAMVNSLFRPDTFSQGNKDGPFLSSAE